MSQFELKGQKQKLQKWVKSQQFADEEGTITSRKAFLKRVGLREKSIQGLWKRMGENNLFFLFRRKVKIHSLFLTTPLRIDHSSTDYILLSPFNSTNWATKNSSPIFNLLTSHICAHFYHSYCLMFLTYTIIQIFTPIPTISITTSLLPQDLS